MILVFPLINIRPSSETSETGADEATVVHELFASKCIKLAAPLRSQRQIWVDCFSC